MQFLSVLRTEPGEILFKNGIMEGHVNNGLHFVRTLYSDNIHFWSTVLFLLTLPCIDLDSKLSKLMECIYLFIVSIFFKGPFHLFCIHLFLSQKISVCATCNIYGFWYYYINVSQ